MAIHTETRGGSYKRGLADVRVRDDAELVIKLDGDDGGTFVVPYDMAKIGIVTDGLYRVSLSSDGSQLFGINPEKGTYIVRYNGMVSSQGQLPAPKLVHGGLRHKKDGKGTFTVPDYLAFTVLLRVVSATCKRMTIPLQLNYSFEQYKTTNETVIPLGTKPLEKTAKFLELAGMDFTKDTIPWSDNVLPYLDELFQERNTKFQVVMKNGYVDEMFEMAPELDED